MVSSTKNLDSFKIPEEDLRISERAKKLFRMQTGLAKPEKVGMGDSGFGKTLVDIIDDAYSLANQDVKAEFGQLKNILVYVRDSNFSQHSILVLENKAQTINKLSEARLTDAPLRAVNEALKKALNHLGILIENGIGK